MVGFRSPASTSAPRISWENISCRISFSQAAKQWKQEVGHNQDFSIQGDPKYPCIEFVIIC